MWRQLRLGQNTKYTPRRDNPRRHQNRLFEVSSQDKLLAFLGVLFRVKTSAHVFGYDASTALYAERADSVEIPSFVPRRFTAVPINSVQKSDSTLGLEK